MKTQQMRLTTFVLTALLALLALYIPTPPIARATTITVTSTEDDGSGTLRDAINHAAPGDTIIFSITGTIMLTGTESIWINQDLTINGPGASNLTIDRGNVSSGYQPQVFNIFSGTVVLSGLTISHASDGAITNHGRLAINNCVLANHSAGTLSHATAIDNFGSLVVDNCTFSGNTNGNSIWNLYGDVTVSNSTFSENTSPDFSAGIFTRKPLTVTNTTFTHNTSGDGGGIFIGDGGIATVINSTFTNNHAMWGGGLTNSSGHTVDLIGNTFANNTADYGGAIYSGNTTAPGSVTNLANSTVYSNMATYGGGGIYLLNGTSNITNTTFSNNGAPSGGAINKPSGNSVRLTNTIVANSTSGANCSSSIMNGGGNLQFGGTNPTSCHIGITVGDPKLVTLADNGGPTRTMALLPGSAAIDTGDDAICAAAPVNNRDQRGIARPQGAHCDIGAFEYGGFVPTSFLNLPLILR